MSYIVQPHVYFKEKIHVGFLISLNTSNLIKPTIFKSPWESAIIKGEQVVLKKDPYLNASELLGDDLKLITQNIRKLLGSNHPVLNTITSYYFQQRGKHIRPLIVLLISHASNPINNHAQKIPHTILDTQRRLAEIIEMIHTASLLHDDVIDDSSTRRGQPTINTTHGNKMAILAGDFLLARASVALAKLKNLDVVELIASVISNLVEGEFMQLRKNNSAPTDIPGKTVSFSDYLEKSYLKTASLIAKSSQAAVLLGAPSYSDIFRANSLYDESLETKSLADSAYEFGKNLGIAFQIIDDLLDFTASSSHFGKPVNADLNLGLATAPVLYAAEEHPDLWPLIDRRFKAEGDVKLSEALNRTQDLARQYSQKAIDSLSNFPDSPAKDALILLCNTVCDRKK